MNPDIMAKMKAFSVSRQNAPPAQANRGGAMTPGAGPEWGTEPWPRDGRVSSGVQASASVAETGAPGDEFVTGGTWVGGV